MPVPAAHQPKDSRTATDANRRVRPTSLAIEPARATLGAPAALAANFADVPVRAMRTQKAQSRTGLISQDDPRFDADHGEAEPGVDASDGVLPAEPMVQRSATWKGVTALHETVSLADMTFGASGSPVTWQMLNGTMLKTQGDADASIKEPVVSTSGSGTAYKAKVDSVPAQEGSDDETVLSPGPWTKVVTKAAARAATGLAACSGAGDTTYTEMGKPSDDAVYKANRRHEDRHVADDKIAFEDTIGAWDRNVQSAKDNGTEFAGTSAADATAKLWAAMGNTPKKVARQYRSLSFTKGDAFHGTAVGGPMSTSNPKSNADCSTCSMETTNPS